MWNKIIEILNKFHQVDARLWEVGTDFYKSWTKLIENIKAANIDDGTNFVKVKMYEENTSVEKRYYMELNGNNITPINRLNKIASQSAIRQYLQVGSALNYIYYSEGDKIVNDFYLNFNIYKYKEKNFSLAEHIIETMCISIASNVGFVRNLGYSILICLLNKVQKLPNDIVIKRRTNSKNKVFKIDVPLQFKTNEWYAKEYIDHVCGEDTKNFGNGKSTYITCVDEILKLYKLDDIIENIYQWSQGATAPETELYSKERTYFRTNILSSRGIDYDKIYSDLENSPANEIHVSLLEACHIYEVREIKRKKDNKEIVSDPNNGILLNAACHKLFDSRIVSFDAEGILRYRKESEGDVKKLFGNLKVNIKQKILNEKMKEYLTKRD
ncbi:MAG: HNH endonuclease [Mycoplasmataceae bacterium]|nr:HNH endonuclease [Mycoplasmataceae bacterium]